eukprot:6485063-Amphidinium_carterae.1
MKENWKDEQLLTTSQQLHEGVLYYMALDTIDDIVKRAQDLIRRRCSTEAQRLPEPHEHCRRKNLAATRFPGRTR